MKPAVIDEFFARLAKQRPNPKSELEYVNPYTLLVAVMISAQMTDSGVNKATRPLFEAYDTPEAIVKLGEAKLLGYFKSINYNKTKAKNVIAMSQALIEHFDGEVPAEREALETLPGVGRKTANVVLNVAFGQSTMAVDTHVFRVSNRTGLAPGKDPRAVEETLLDVVPKKWARHAHHWLILHGRYVCKAKKPDCPTCVVNDLCTFKDKTKP